MLGVRSFFVSATQPRHFFHIWSDPSAGDEYKSHHQNDIFPTMRYGVVKYDMREGIKEDEGIVSHEIDH